MKRVFHYIVISLVYFFMVGTTHAYFYAAPIIYKPQLEPSPLSIPGGTSGSFTTPVTFELSLAIVNPNLFDVILESFNVTIFDRDFFFDDRLGALVGSGLNLSIEAGTSIYLDPLAKFLIAPTALNDAIAPPIFGFYPEGRNLETYARGVIKFDLPEDVRVQVSFVTPISEPSPLWLSLLAFALILIVKSAHTHGENRHEP